MKKLAFLFGFLSLILLSGSLLVSRTESDGFTYKHKGWPLVYKETVDTHGLCIGLEGAEEKGGACGLREYPTNYTNLAGNIALSLGLSAVLTAGLHRTKII